MTSHTRNHSSTKYSIANHDHQKLTEKEEVSALTKCHQRGGMYSIWPGCSTQSRYGVDANSGNRAASTASTSTSLELVVRCSSLAYRRAELLGAYRRTYLLPTTCTAGE
jgi:hypothetical protein